MTFVDEGVTFDPVRKEHPLGAFLLNCLLSTLLGAVAGSILFWLTHSLP